MMSTTRSSNFDLNYDSADDGASLLTSISTPYDAAAQQQLLSSSTSFMSNPMLGASTTHGFTGQDDLAQSTSTATVASGSHDVVMAAILNAQSKVRQLEIANDAYEREANILKLQLDKLHREYDLFCESQQAKGEEKARVLRREYEVLFAEEEKRNASLKALEERNNAAVAQIQEGKVKEAELKSAKKTASDELHQLALDFEMTTKSIAANRNRETGIGHVVYYL
jgi:chromosome segregation ATPase